MAGSEEALVADHRHVREETPPAGICTVVDLLVFEPFDDATGRESPLSQAPRGPVAQQALDGTGAGDDGDDGGGEFGRRRR